jgi:hypothetical protein
MKLVGACLALLAVLVATQSAWADIHIDLSSLATDDYPAFNVGTATDPGPDRALILCEYCNSLNNALKFLRMGTLPLSPMLVAALDSLQVFMVTRSGGTANLVQWTF